MKKSVLGNGNKQRIRGFYMKDLMFETPRGTQVLSVFSRALKPHGTAGFVTCLAQKTGKEFSKVPSPYSDCGPPLSLHAWSCGDRPGCL